MTDINDTLKVSVLASGSGGNATYFETPNQKILIDAGLSGKKLEELMNSIGRSLSQVDSLLLSHEHSDHCKGVGVLARRYDLNIYANKKTWEALGDKLGNIPSAKKHLFEPETLKKFGDIDVESFAISHDAANPQFYALHHANNPNSSSGMKFGKTFIY